MADKCKSCNAKVIKFPLWKGQEHGEKFSWDKLILINLFKMDWYSMMMIIVIIFITWSYVHDTKEYFEIIEDPCGYCERSNCCEVLQIKKWQNVDMPIDDTGYIIDKSKDFLINVS